MIARRQSYTQKIERRLKAFLQNSNLFPTLKIGRELYVLFFFCFLFFCIILRLVFVQIIYAKDYEAQLNEQHVSESSLKAQRGQIYVYDKSGQPVKLTENIELFTVFVDPYFVYDKAFFISKLAPFIYKHLCVLYGVDQIGPLQCIRNVEKFTNTTILPKEPDVFYMGSGITVEDNPSFDRSGYNTETTDIIQKFSTGTYALDLIKTALDQKIQQGVRPSNYLGNFDNKDLLASLSGLWPWIQISSVNYVSILPSKVTSVSANSKAVLDLLHTYGYQNDPATVQAAFYPQENRYVRLITDANPEIAQQIEDMKAKYFTEFTDDQAAYTRGVKAYGSDYTGTKLPYPMFHGLGLEKDTKRYYPFGDFLANVLGYVDNKGDPFYGIEQYFNDQLKGQDGTIVGRSSAWMGQIGANDFEVQQPVNGDDIYLTIQPNVQKQIEKILPAYQATFRSDSISAVVLNVFDGKVAAMVNYPSFDPNDVHTAYTLTPVGSGDQYLIDDITSLDMPIFINTGGVVREATLDERKDPSLKKYRFENTLWPQVFVDKNIAFPYEPGSIFKAFTVGIGLDMDEISLYDFYTDEGKLKVGPFTIHNVVADCLGTNTFLHALEYSCNIGMVRIAQKIQKQGYYNYLEKLGMWQLTNIELEGEDPGYVESVNSVSDTRFFNNAFGQGLLATPLQIAAWYAALLNGWYYVQPTIIDKIYDTKTNTYIPNTTKILRQVMKPAISDEMKEALFEDVENLKLGKLIHLPGYSLGGKSGTSQISFKGVYKSGNGWTNASFVGVVTKNNLKYVVVVQVRRPRSVVRWDNTAGVIFKQIAQILINEDLIPN